MAAIIILAVLGSTLFPATLYYLEVHRKKTPSLIAKAICSLTFVILGFLCGRNSTIPDFANAFFIGEIFGAVGDVVINLGPWVKNKNITFCTGGASFFIGHIFYVAAVAAVNMSGIYLSIILTAAVFAGILILLYRFTHIEKVMRILISVYMLIVSAFFAFSLSAFIAQPCTGRAVLAFGSLVFLFSDFDLMLQNFGKKKSGLVFKCMYLYYPAQIVIALGLYWFA